MYTTTLTHSREVATGTGEFSFARPDGFSYQAGQTIDLTLIDPSETDAEGNTRTFSLVSAPGDANLTVATRLRDTAFKRVLRALPEGAAVSFDGPFGSFLLHENTARPAVFLSGGIGITPFHSMIADATSRALPHRMFLFYSNRRPEDAAYLNEMTSFTKQNSRFTFIPTMTDVEHSALPWDGERGYIDAAMLARHLPKDAVPVYYLAGPPGMVTVMRGMLTGMGVSNDDIRFEEFAGY